MDWFKGEDVGAFGRYDDAGDTRCPICYVPPGAPHLNSCEDTGIWHGKNTGESTPADEWDT